MHRRNRFATNDIVRIPLSHDDWIEVKRELTNGETQQLRRAALPTVRREGETLHQEMDIDLIAYHAALVELYLVDWSFVDEDDKRVPLSKTTIDALEADTVDEIKAALDAHMEAVAEEKKALNRRNGYVEPAPSSPQPDGPMPISLTHPRT